jgi:NitT/TauT family transport system substrate-binding protein
MPDKGIEQPEDLAGHTLAVNQPKATLELNSRVALDDVGIDPDDVNFQVIPLSTMVDALVGGQVDSAYLLPPFSTLAEAQGAEMVLDAYAGVLEGSPIAGYVMTCEFAEDNPNTVAAVQLVMTEAAEAMNDPAEYRSFIPTYTSLTAELAEQAPAFEFPTTIDVDSLQEYADLMTKYEFATREVDIAEAIIQPNA